MADPGSVDSAVLLPTGDPAEMLPKYAFSVAEAAQVIGIGERTLRDLLRDDMSFPRAYLGRRVVIPARALEEWINERARSEARASSRAIQAFMSAEG